MLDRLLPNPYPAEYILGVGTVFAFSASEGLLPGIVLKLVRFQNFSPSSHTLEALSSHPAVRSGKQTGDEASSSPSETTSSTDGGISNPANAPSNLRSMSDKSTSSNALAGPASSSSSSPSSAPPRASRPDVVSKSKSNMSLQLSLASGDPIHGKSGAGSRDKP